MYMHIIKHLLFIHIFIALIDLSGQNITTDTIALNAIAGKWYVQYTNFPMWLNGNKINPEFNYTVTERKGNTVLLDEVVFEKNGKQKNITGYDKIMDANNSKFIWRGKGFLVLLKSKWDIVFADESGEWILIHFDKTIFTPEGYDVITRNKNLDAELQNTISKILSEKIPGVLLSVTLKQ